MMNTLVYDYIFCKRASVLNGKASGCYDNTRIINCVRAASVIMAHCVLLTSDGESMLRTVWTASKITDDLETSSAARNYSPSH
jgi:hypothetical protein